jgi:hypothetical protein
LSGEMTRRDLPVWMIEEEVRETHAHHRHSLRRARCTSGS